METQKVSIRNVIEHGIERLFPGYFALVMATGIVSIATYLLQVSSLVAWLLFQMNIVAYGILWLLTVIRLFRYFSRVVKDFTHHTTGVGFFTIIAGTCVLGSQFVILAEDFTTGFLFWILGGLLWCPLIFTFFSTVMVKRSKSTLGESMSGAWLIIVVSTQSLSVLGVMLAPLFGTWGIGFLFFGLASYLLGCMLYLMIITLIFYRMVFLPLMPEDFLPSYWINMGATAITTLAGALLILNASQWTFLGEVLPFLKGFTLFFWIIGTWWIPLLIILEVWRHLYKRFPISYDPRYWNMVFPLGMYTACTFQFAKATGLSFLLPISHYSLYAALLAWAATFVGLVHRLWSSLLIRTEIRPDVGVTHDTG